ncbi:MAG: arsenate reductase ArsC [Planctomycetota bacterium]
MSMKHKVMFVCSHNSARSQMAEGWLRHLAGDDFEVYSSGIEPGTLRPEAVTAMNEVGIDISGQKAEGVSKYLGYVEVQYLVIVCAAAEKACPAIWPGVIGRFFWDLPDPSAAQGSEEERLAVFREVRDQIREKMDPFIEQIKADPLLKNTEVPAK